MMDADVDTEEEGVGLGTEAGSTEVSPSIATGTGSEGDISARSELTVLDIWLLCVLSEAPACRTKITTFVLKQVGG